jgi:hypothetical protein
MTYLGKSRGRPNVNAGNKVCTVLEKIFIRQAGRGMWVGSIFNDHGKTMRITAIGQVYKMGKERLIDLTAIETEDNQENR